MAKTGNTVPGYLGGKPLTQIQKDLLIGDDNDLSAKMDIANKNKTLYENAKTSYNDAKYKLSNPTQFCGGPSFGSCVQAIQADVDKYGPLCDSAYEAWQDSIIDVQDAKDKYNNDFASVKYELMYGKKPPQTGGLTDTNNPDIMATPDLTTDINSSDNKKYIIGVIVVLVVVVGLVFIIKKIQ